MKSFESISCNFFSTVLQILDYMNNSSENLIRLLNKYEPQNSDECKQKDEYKILLEGIKARSERIKEEMLVSTLQQIELIDKKQIQLSWFEELDKELQRLSYITRKLSEPQMYIDSDGNLILKRCS